MPALFTPGASDLPPCSPLDASSNALNSRPPSEKSSIVELKNGKVVFKQKPISFEKHSETLQEIVKFRDLLEDRVAKKAEGLSAIPEEHKPVIAKLVHESDKTLSALCKHILQELLPDQDEDGEPSSAPPPLTLSVLESGIKSVASRNNFGLDGMPGIKAPAAVCAWRWEVRTSHLEWLPKNAREKAEVRMAERVQAKLDLKKQFDALPKSEQDSILDPKGTAGVKVPGSSTTIDLTGDSPVPAKKNKESEEHDTTNAPKVGRPKKIPDPEKLAKEKEKQEKKAAKAEREQREKEAQNKSRSLMKSFFKTNNAPGSTPTKQTIMDGPSVTDPSQYRKNFKPFIVKKDTDIAPVNWFATHKELELKYDGDSIIVDDDVGPGHDHADLANQSTKDRLESVLKQLAPPPHRRRRPRVFRSSLKAPLKTVNAVSVRDLMAQLNEAEVSGDVALVRILTSKLSDVPPKVFIFADDARPGYFGTWSRDSRIIGPRSALKRDVAMFDYDYDSGEEWEAEPSNEGDDIVDDGEDEELDGDDPDSDADSWLVDDDDDEPQSRAASRGPSPALQAPAKRKAETQDSKLSKKRKLVVPLVPFARGPCWEETIGKCEHPLFNPYRIQLFNDTPFPIDPFTFVSQVGEVVRASNNNGGFAIPPLPSRLMSQLDASVLPPVAKRPAPAPKTTFPDAHMPHLLNRITNTQTASLPILVDTIYQDLRDHKVKKNSIEAKVREVAEKCKLKKVWVVKENFKGPTTVH
ncbi:chromatin assembly factor 1 subunit A-domain-containing protein [Mycena amicta]|nr:chromatin assembly factor 1 subunit A-domain-containing protein [Mycena amicta]